jgi:hypothetical protein
LIDFPNGCFGFFNSRSLPGVSYSRAMKTNLRPFTIENQTYTPRILAVSLLAGILLVCLTGCKNNEQRAAASPDPAGIYSLVTLDGKSVPCELSHAGTSMKIQSGTFTINADGTCSSAITLTLANKQDMTKVTKAAYTRQGTELTMTWEGAGTTRGAVNGSNFVMTNEGMVFAYRK